MSRVISGRYGGLFLRNPRHAIRPTTGKIKEYIFNVLQPFEAAHAIDLFSGTGALGIEALSRGAEYVTFVDNNYHSIKLIKENLQRINAERDTWQCYKANALHFLERSKECYDIIFADPPYGLDIPEEFFRSCREHLRNSGIFVLEYSAKKTIATGYWKHFRYKEMGDTAVWMFR
ncbi:MAG: 16S rRNA (guanine(966)-N(2))-methyltransferase RsmD [Fidelibacterota bacterium]